MQLFDDDDFLSTTPRENFFQILHSANRNIVDQELERLIERLAAAERLIEERGAEEEYERLVQSHGALDPADQENRKNSIFIETVGRIVSQCE